MVVLRAWIIIILSNPFKSFQGQLISLHILFKILVVQKPKKTLFINLQSQAPTFIKVTNIGIENILEMNEVSFSLFIRNVMSRRHFLRIFVLIYALNELFIPFFYFCYKKSKYHVLVCMFVLLFFISSCLSCLAKGKHRTEDHATYFGFL